MTHAFTLSKGVGANESLENIKLNPLERRPSSVENTTEIQLTLSDKESRIRKPESLKNAV